MREKITWASYLQKNLKKVIKDLSNTDNNLILTKTTKHDDLSDPQQIWDSYDVGKCTQ